MVAANAARAARCHRASNPRTGPALWGAHHDLTGPVPLSWPEALELLSAELGEPATFQVAAERQLFISPATVAYHLGKVFTKLSISSRRQLARTLPIQPDAARAATPQG